MLVIPRAYGSYNNSMKNYTPHNPHKTIKTTAFATASIVTALSVAERALGFLYRIVLSRLLGAEGVGLYQVALSVFSVFLTIGTGGIPLTVSRLISKSKAQNDIYGEKSAVSAGLFLCILLTLPVSILLGVFPNTVSFLFSDERSLTVFRILLLGLTVTSIYAVFRGYFWGNKQFLLPSVLEIAEETVMVVAGVLLLRNVSNATTGANLAGWAVVVSYVFSFLASALCFFFGGGKLAKPQKQLKPLFNATLPITSVRASGTLVNSAVAVLLPAMLVRAGMSETEALTLFGVISGMAIPVLFIPSTIIGSLSLVLVPELSENFYRKDAERLYENLSKGLCVSTLVACFLLPFFYAFGDELGKIAFSEPLAGEFIRRGCPLLLPMSLTMISTGMLNSMGFEKQTFVYYFLGAAAMLLCVLLLPAVCGGYAYIIGLGASYIVTATCNLLLLNKKCPKLYTKIFKRQGQVFIHSVFKAFFAVLPIALCGDLFVSLFQAFTGEFLCMLLSGVALLLLTALIWILLGIIPVKKKIYKIS